MNTTLIISNDSHEVKNLYPDAYRVGSSTTIIDLMMIRGSRPREVIIGQIFARRVMNPRDIVFAELMSTIFAITEIRHIDGRRMRFDHPLSAAELKLKISIFLN